MKANGSFKSSNYVIPPSKRLALLTQFYVNKRCYLKEYLTSFEVELICMHTLNDMISFQNLLIAKVNAGCVIQSSLLNLSLLMQSN